MPPNRNLNPWLGRLLLIASILLQSAIVSAGGPPRSPDSAEGVSVINPGSELWREVRQRDFPIAGVSQVRGVESGVLINVHGDRWARFRTGELVRYSGWILAGIGILLLVFYVLRGRVGVQGGLSGKMVERFSEYERIVHWTLAIVFLWLALTGLVLLFGRPLLLPILGRDVFSLLASASKEGHNLFGPLFLVSLLMMLASFARRNLYERGDLTWLLRGGGFIGKGHVSGGFFNMGEKSWYWLVILVGLVIAVSGLVLVSPNFGQGRIVMEIAHIVHVFGAMILIAVSIGHMYMGSVGTEGSAEGMLSGHVDLNWAEAHHDRWARQCRERDLVITAEEFTRRTGRKPPAAGGSAVSPEGN